MARPRLDEQERRARTVSVRVTAAEAAELRLGPAELRELNRIGVNLNQIARLLNSGAVRAPAGTRGAVERVEELVAGLLSGEGE